MILYLPSLLLLYENYILKIDDICAIRIFPAGDSGWNSLDSILTIAAFVVGTVVTGGWLGLVVGAGAAAVYAGSSLALDYFGGGDTIGEWLLKKSLPENGSSSSADAQENLMKTACALIENPERIALMEKNIAGLALRDAAMTIADEVYRIVK